MRFILIVIIRALKLNRKRLRYLELVKQLKEKYKQVRFLNSSGSAFGLFDTSSSDFIDLMKGLQMDSAQTSFDII